MATFHDSLQRMSPTRASHDINSPRIQRSATEKAVFEKLHALVERSDQAVLESYFDDEAALRDNLLGPNKAVRFVNLLTNVTRTEDGENKLRDVLLDESNPEGEEDGDEVGRSVLKEWMLKEQKVKTAFRMFKDRFPPQIWHCCKRLCFASIAIDSMQFRLLEELLVIHEHAEKCHSERELLPVLVEKRRRGVGKSSMVFGKVSRAHRERGGSAYHGTGRKSHLHEFSRFVREVLPFLYGLEDSPRGTPRPEKKLCTQAICSLLGVSRNFLYNRRAISNGDDASEDDIESVIDSAGIRMRQHRRQGHRVNLPPVQSLPEYDCGCDVPCFAEVPTWSLVSEYEDFCKLSRDLRPRQKENCFLLNRLYNPLTNSTLKVCNKALAVLYNVSESLIADVRGSLDSLCEEASRNGVLSSSPIDGTARYRYDRRHPINKLPDWIREKLETHLDFILRADPAGTDESRVCRVYSPEINTQEKLRTVLMKELACEDSLDTELSGSTVQRMVKAYLKRRNFDSISFTQSDHNACPQCKSLQYAVLQFSHEAKVAKREIDHLMKSPRPFTEDDQARLHVLPAIQETKRCQEEECLSQMVRHNERDMRIRGFLKKLCDHFRDTENRYRKSSTELNRQFHCSWNSFLDRASITHQDDMTKVDLPHFIVTASADITRWRFDVNAHVNAVTNDAVVFSHEQGMGAKNASLIVEEIIMEHLVGCKGESIKIIVSDNAAVGKNWLTTIALPQYMVDQELAEVVMMVFLENNHGKWLADMLFGQFQTRRRRSTILGIDDMLDGFEAIKRRNGKVRGFALNPLSSVDFLKVFESLGYECLPPKAFGFTKRNIHFATACAPGAKKRLPLEIRELLSPMLPDDAGMVRISTEPFGTKAQSELRYEDRFFDVPAARTVTPGVAASRAKQRVTTLSNYVGCADGAEINVPLVVPVDKKFASSGSGVVSHRTAEHVGYNGIEFSKLDACAEMRQSSSLLVRRAWPRGLFRPYGLAQQSDEPVAGEESMKCAPLNWILRRPVSHFCTSDEDWKARYPPQNMLNAKFRQGPREKRPWIPTATYEEPPFPIIEGTASCTAMKILAARYTELGDSLHVLHALREVFREMGDRDCLSDPWLQKRATVPSEAAILRYQNDLQVFVERESGHPKGVISLKKAFREDEEVAKEIERLVSEKRSAGASANRLEEEVVNTLYKEFEGRPGALDRIRVRVERDQERYANELKAFKESQKQYDRDRGLLPQQYDENQ